MKHRLMAVTALLAFVAGCGGGGKGNIRPEPVLPPTAPAEPVEEEDTGPSGPESKNDGEAATRIVEYLRVHAGGGPWESIGGHTMTNAPKLARFIVPPTVRIVEGATERERAVTHRAVALINRALPYEQHLVFGEDIAPEKDGPWRRDVRNVPDGHIIVEFVEGPISSGAAGIAVPHATQEYLSAEDRWRFTHMRAAVATMSRTEGGGRDERLLKTVAHELLHCLVFDGHVGEEFTESILHYGGPPLTGDLPPIDAQALQVVYTRLAGNTNAEDLSVASLGPWSQESMHLSQEIGPVAFGVRHANDLSVPWTQGPLPAQALNENPRLAGSASWRGALVGLTPAQATVSGDATLTVDIGQMDGTAEFTDLETWGKNAAIGTKGAGEIWSTGRLRYDIAVGGNYLRSTGGDEGTVNGQFYGHGHTHVAGSVERDDLTAAFGARREP